MATFKRILSANPITSVKLLPDNNRYNMDVWWFG